MKQRTNTNIHPTYTFMLYIHIHIQIMQRIRLKHKSDYALNQISVPPAPNHDFYMHAQGQKNGGKKMVPGGHYCTERTI